MELETTINIESMKDKLQHLEQYLPGQEKTTYEFGRYLSERINQKITPDGFVNATQTVLYDLSQGVNGISGEPTPENLSKLPSFVYLSLQIQVPQIAQAIFPEDVANSVKSYIQSMNKN